MPVTDSRTRLAHEIARQLLRPGILDLPMRSGLFLTGLDRTGKETFFRQELIPALQSVGRGSGKPKGRVLVIHVDLSFEGTNVSPAEIILRAVRAKLHEFTANGLWLKYHVPNVGTEAGVTLADAFTEVVDKAGTDLVLIVDEIQESLRCEESLALLKALKAARDAVNLRPNTRGYFLFVCAGSPRELVESMTVGTEAAFTGAMFRDLSTPIQE